MFINSVILSFFNVTTMIAGIYQTVVTYSTFGTTLIILQILNLFYLVAIQIDLIGIDIPVERPSQIILASLVALDLQILSVFSPLQNRIKPNRIRILKYSLIVIFILGNTLSFLTAIRNWFGAPFPDFAVVGQYTLLVWIFIAIFFDIIQMMYVTRIAFSFERRHSVRLEEITKFLLRIGGRNYILLLMGLSIVGIYFAASFQDDESKSLHQIAHVLIGIRLIGAVNVFFHLTKSILTDRGVATFEKDAGKVEKSIKQLKIEGLIDSAINESTSSVNGRASGIPSAIQEISEHRNMPIMESISEDL